MPIQLELRKQRINALYESIKKHKKVTISQVYKKTFEEWGLSRKTTMEYIRCLEYKPDIEISDGYIAIKQSKNAPKQ